MTDERRKELETVLDELSEALYALVFDHPLWQKGSPPDVLHVRIHLFDFIEIEEAIYRLNRSPRTAYRPEFEACPPTGDEKTINASWGSFRFHPVDPYKRPDYPRNELRLCLRPDAVLEPRQVHPRGHLSLIGKNPRFSWEERGSQAREATIPHRVCVRHSPRSAYGDEVFAYERPVITHEDYETAAKIAFRTNPQIRSANL